MPTPKTLIGLDWGTHSSKWTWRGIQVGSGGSGRERFKIVRSEVCLEEGGERIFLDEQPPRHGSLFASSVKRRLIQNPDGPFWEGAQKTLRLPLGHMAAFSLWCLLGQAYGDIHSRIDGAGEIEVRFSLPNWVDIPEGRVCYEQAARVACHIFAQDREAWIREPGPTRDRWRAMVRGALESLGLSDEVRAAEGGQDFRSMLRHEYGLGGGVSFRFVAESSAAGLAGLRRSGEGDPGHVLKILVVDVGAGSTDIGYVLRSIPPKGSGDKEVLCQLPPANTCEIAGEDLTRRVREIYKSQGRSIGFDEAERIKIEGADQAWLKHPAIRSWIAGISDHVESYVASVQDKRWLPYDPGLRVLVTGGSGVVPGLRESVAAAASKGLEKAGVAAGVTKNTEAMTVPLTGPAARDVNRLVVALGAASEELPRLSYYDKLDPPKIGHSVRPRPSWTGKY